MHTYIIIQCIKSTYKLFYIHSLVYTDNKLYVLKKIFLMKIKRKKITKDLTIGLRDK